MYYQDPQDLEDLGWDRVVAQIWETIFVGYRSTAGIRTMARHWSDLLQVGVGCSPAVADLLVRDRVVAREDQDLFAIRDAVALLTAMTVILDDIGRDLADSPDIAAADRTALLAGHQAVAELVRDEFGDAEEAEEAEEEA